MYSVMQVPCAQSVARQLARCGLVLGIVLPSSISQQLYLDTDGTEAGTRTGDGEDGFNGTTYSVIVVASNPRPSSHFRDEQRVRYFNRLSGERDVVSVKFGTPTPQTMPSVDNPPFGLRHPNGVNKRVRLIFWPDLGRRQPSDSQVRK